MSTASARRRQSLRGHLRKLVSELWQQVRLNKPCQSGSSNHRQSDPVVGLVAIQRAFDSPLFTEKPKKHLLTMLIELLRIQIHRGSRATTVIHEPHRQGQRRQLHFWSPLLARLIEEAVIRRQRRQTSCHETTRSPSTVTSPYLRRCTHKLSEVSVFPFDIALLSRRVVDLERRVGLAAHAAVTEQRTDDDAVLHFRQTSHGITQFTVRFGPHPGDWVSPLLADAKPTFLPAHPR